VAKKGKKKTKLCFEPKAEVCKSVPPDVRADDCGVMQTSLESLDSDFKKKVEAVIAALKMQKDENGKAKYRSPKAIETRRNTVRQACLVSTCKSKTYKSRHLCGLAVDIINNVKGFDWKKTNPFWADLGAAAKKHGLEWGGDWKKGFEDMPHIQSPRTCP
jgi:hypothetical protein